MSRRRMRQKDAIVLSAVLAFVILVLLVPLWSGFTWAGDPGNITSENAPETDASSGAVSASGSVVKEDTGEARPILDPEGKTLEQRINPPEGYERREEDMESLTVFLRTYSMKKDGRAVRLYDGSKKENQDAHMAVFKLPLEKEDLQQCADTVMRVYAEYYWKIGKQEKISFRFVDGFQADYVRWREGYRIQVGSSGTSWVDSGSYDDSYDNFKKYLRMVFSYASTLSLKAESKKIKLPNIQVGDIFIKDGSPGHVVMVVDVCENEEGKKAFLLGQGFMPAQQFHLLKNPAHEEDPWYYEEEVTYPFETPEYTFQKGSLMRPGY